MLENYSCVAGWPFCLFPICPISDLAEGPGVKKSPGGGKVGRSRRDRHHVPSQ